MPYLTFSAGSFSFQRGSTISNIKQNNNVDNVNKNNNNVNDNLDTLAYNTTMSNNLNVLPLERRARSFDNLASETKSNRRNSNSNSNRKTWFKTIFSRIHHTLSRWNYDDNDDDDEINNSNFKINVRDCSDVKDINKGEVDDDIDDPIIMKSRNFIAESKTNSYVRHGNTHDFYVVKKNNSLKDDLLKRSQMFNNNDDYLKAISSSSVFEKCAQTPRHFTKETEVLGKVGRFTIVREPENFDTTYFDKCHCQQKPCRFSINGCCGNHPVSSESLPKFKCGNDCPPSNVQKLDAAALMSYRRSQLTSSSCSNKNDSWPKSRRLFYSNSTPSSNSSMHSISSSFQKPYNNNINGASALPISISKVTSNSNSNSYTYCRVILPQSSSSPNLFHLYQRSKIEGVQNKSPNSRNFIIGGNSGNYPNPPTNSAQCTTVASVIKKPIKSLLMNSKDNEEKLRSKSMPLNTDISISPPLNKNSSSTPPTPTKFSFTLNHNPNNEPHTTINSHTGRKFEVEWNTTAKSSSSSSSSSSTSSSTTSSSISSSDTAYSPPSTISSVYSVSSSPDKKSSITTTTTLSRRCSTLSSKGGRKFEVTVLSSSTGSNHSLNTSPHSTINSINSIIDTANTDLTNC